MIVLMDLDLMKTRGKASKGFLFVSKVYGRMPPVETMRDLEYFIGYNANWFSSCLFGLFLRISINIKGLFWRSHVHSMILLNPYLLGGLVFSSRASASLYPSRILPLTVAVIYNTIKIDQVTASGDWVNLLTCVVCG